MGFNSPQFLEAKPTGGLSLKRWMEGTILAASNLHGSEITRLGGGGLITKKSKQATKLSNNQTKGEGSYYCYFFSKE